MPVVIVDGKEIEIGAQERLNGIQVAQRAGAEVPHYCWHPGLSVVASCRMCLVECGQKDAATGKIAMQPRLVPACQTPAKEGTVFVTNSQKVIDARAMVEEDLLLRHPVDCPICDKAGECSLQDYHFEYGRDQRRADIQPFSSRRRELGDTVTLFVDRCVMCTRCVRFTREISGTNELMVINRGAHEEIDVFRNDAGELQFPLDNKMSGNVCDLCPVGALGDKDFLYKQRVWFMKSHDNVCAGCSTGCSIKVEENQDHIYRLKPRENPHVNQWWMCDDGRYGWKHVHDEGRQIDLRRKSTTASNGSYTNLDWHALPAELEKSLTAAGKLGVVLSPHLTVEEAFLLVSYIRRLDPQAIVAMGPIPVEGTDEKFKNGFTIHAEKCPNRRGVDAVAANFAGKVIDWNEFLTEHASSLGGVWISGGYKTNWNDAAAVEKLSGVKTLIVQDCFASPLWDAATYQVPGGTFAEREGSYVNFNDRLQSFRWAIRAPAGVLVEGQLFWQLAGRSGLYQAKQVLAEAAREIPFFAPALSGVHELGVDLKVNQLAAAGAPQPAVATT
ncbi:NADH-quinone oxidoreductase subunit G [Anatilimnocola aggregata]|uniref:NADH-quinone oxidoreductase subunit G n=1 Tax=Anatilimnocola aggregata TaxID=2528021 RepID=A0A517YA50_9BACT|nr:2Fe-2S iron-sulfur cluster-binding protein [Anatilimnocola aggregata]QDU27109.1 NADH-quinone oxidoreductase subunit G [Anatilimnocola aggregata]